MITPRKILSVFVAGEPKGQPRPRAFVRGGRAAVYDPSTAEGWKSEVARAFADHETARHDGPFMVELRFEMRRPKSHFGKKGLKPSAPTRLFAKKPDADNLAKAVLDALTSLKVWHDDDAVTDLIVRKRWADADGRSGCRVTIYQLEDS